MRRLSANNALAMLGYKVAMRRLSGYAQIMRRHSEAQVMRRLMHFSKNVFFLHVCTRVLSADNAMNERVLSADNLHHKRTMRRISAE